MTDIIDKSVSRTYRKRPIVIWAFQLTEDQLKNFGPFPEWAKDDLTPDIDSKGKRDERHILIRTKEGTMIAEEGTYIICGVWGELYPCQKHIFESTYDLVQE